MAKVVGTKADPAARRYGVLFVCTGNICRSPTAEGVFRHLVTAADLAGRIHVDSAGTHGYHVGEPPDHRSIAAARRRGYDLSKLRARRMTSADFAQFDLLIALDEDHASILERARPKEAATSGAAMATIRLMLEYARPPRQAGVPDPYYGGPAGFEHVLDLIEDASRGLLEAVRQELTQRT